MGMFDDIIVPKSYLKGLLTKDQENLIKNNNYQTKSLENFLGRYKVYRQKLFIKKDKEWVKDTYTGKINFYTSFSDKDENTWWSEYEFIFRNGIIDKKELLKFEIQETAAEAKKREECWIERHAETAAFQRTFKYKFFEKVRAVLSSILEWVQKQTILPSPNSVKIDRQRSTKRRKKPSFWKDS